MIHQNPVAPGLPANEAVGLPPPTEGVKIEPNGQFVSHSLGIAVTVATTITTAANAAALAGATQAVIQADSGTTAAAAGLGVRYTLDGTTPTASSGLFIPAGQSITLNMADAAAAKFIQTAVAVNLNVLFTM
jgi:hypothetical protein